MKVSTILSKLEAIAARSERLWLEAHVSTGCKGDLVVESCTFRFDHWGDNTFVVAHVFPPGSCSDAVWRQMLSGLDERVVAFLENQK